jgi:hypothetical protein
MRDRSRDDLAVPETQEETMGAQHDCITCTGEGWVIDHADECYESQECVGCGGVQRECANCGGTGKASA